MMDRRENGIAHAHDCRGRESYGELWLNEGHRKRGTTVGQMIPFGRQVPVRHDVDIFVAGGGPAGLAAAVAAARQGRTVFLAEGQACFGGLGTAGMVPAFMPFGNGPHFLTGGIGREVLDRLLAAGGTGPKDDIADNRRSVAIKVEYLKRVYDAMAREAGFQFTFHTQLIGVETDDGRMTAAVCSAKSGLFAVKAKIYVDGTGDGDLCAWAGAPFEKGDAEGTMMPGTLASLWANIDFAAHTASGLKVHEQLLRAIADGVFTHTDRHLPGFWIVAENVGGGNIGHTFGVDGTDERSLTKALIWGRQSMLEYERFYKQYLKGYERMVLVQTGAILGVRETRRIMGDYRMTLQDFRSRASFDDEIGRFSYPVDIHPLKPDAQSYEAFETEWKNLRYKDGESYGIPYRALVPKTLTNVLVAGRCISTDRHMQGSIRVMPGCYITGQAVGVAAALAVEGNCDTRSITVAELQRRLVKMGGVLPNAPK